MNRIVLLMLVLSLMVACDNWGYSADLKPEQPKLEEHTTQKPEQTTEQEKAIAIIKELGATVPNKPVIMVEVRSEEQEKTISEIQNSGGKVIIDEKSPDKPVIGVDLYGTKVTDNELEQLKELTQLQTLALLGNQVTDAGVQHLIGLTQLQTLNLARTQVTDAGLAQLKGLTKLRMLYLSNTQVTDSGLEHLKGFTQLRTLTLLQTEVTDEGVKKLQDALPNCCIYYDRIEK